MGNWSAAIDTLNLIVGQKAKVFIDSVASLVPLSEFELAVSYQERAKNSEAHNHLSSALKIWRDADPELTAHFKDSSYSTACEIPNNH
jgi:hypothetical protein